MSVVVEFGDEALVESRGAAAWYADQDVDTASRFAAAVAAARNRLSEYPESGSPHLHGTRRMLLANFPFELVYLFDGSTVRVIAVAHTSRRTGYWRSRVT